MAVVDVRIVRMAVHERFVHVRVRVGFLAVPREVVGVLVVFVVESIAPAAFLTTFVVTVYLYGVFVVVVTAFVPIVSCASNAICPVVGSIPIRPEYVFVVVVTVLAFVVEYE